MLLLHLLKAVNVRIAGDELKDVTCEKCGTPFHYLLSRFAIGRWVGLIFMDNTRGHAIAQKRAREELMVQLTRGVELVPCPACDWVNEGLVRAYRRSSHRFGWAVVLVTTFIAIPLGCMLAMLAALLPLPEIVLGPLLVLLSFTGCLMPLWMWLYSTWRRRSIQPNIHWPDGPAVVPPGTPQAMIQETEHEDGSATLVSLPSETDLHMGEDGWVVCQENQLEFPPVCCVCLADADRVFQPCWSIFKAWNPSVPICKACNRWYRFRGLMILIILTLAGPPLGFAMMLASVYLPAPADTFLLALGFILQLGIFAGPIVYLYWGGILNLPYRIQHMDKERGLVRFKARHPGFTQLMVDQVQRQMTKDYILQPQEE